MSAILTTPRAVPKRDRTGIVLPGVQFVNQTIAPLKPVSKTTLSEQIAIQLVSELDAKRWKPGEKLPSETELCKVFNVGRSTLREALKSLSFVGLIRMQAGGGSYVAELRPKYIEASLLHTQGRLNTDKEVDDFCEARALLETEIAALFSQRATAQDIKTLENILRQMKACVDMGGENFSDLDLSFHIAIAAACKNDLLTDLVKHIRTELEESIAKSLLLPASVEIAYQQHKVLLEAFKERSPRRARAAMRAHLRTFRGGFKVLSRTSR
jgi:GntR family transcriptional repressor for pyruvate dehydrogenase complex